MPRSPDSTTAAACLNTDGPRLTRRATLGLLAVAPGLLLPRQTPTGEPASRSLFDGRSLGAWKPVVFGGDGEVRIADGAIQFGRGNDLTGVVWSGALPGPSYRVALEAMRVDGTDFFCALTFPIAGSHCSLVVGGWGGGVVGLSSLDGLDASENETSRGMRLESRRWYAIAVEVTRAYVRATIDGEPMVDIDVTGRAVDTRPELELCKPLGLATWRTIGAIRAITLTDRA
ncbi:MAG: DUF1080 domain-containing protein [Acidobacteria bacterium]|nr:DUF1080 domain-containing protein [Acidobacteriota bacterium]